MIPPWLNIGPELFLQAAQAGGNIRETQAARAQQGQLAQQQLQQQDAQRGFQYDQLAQQAQEAEAQRQNQYQINADSMNARIYEANLQAQARSSDAKLKAEAQARAQMENARLVDQGQERALSRTDKLGQNSILNDLARKKQESDMAQFGTSSGLRAGELGARKDELAYRKDKKDKADKLDNDLFNSVKEGIAAGITVTEQAKIEPRILSIKAVKALFDMENRPKTYMEQLGIVPGMGAIGAGTNAPPAIGTNRFRIIKSSDEQ